MWVVSSHAGLRQTPNERIASAVDSVFAAELREFVETVSVPRHYFEERVQNLTTRDWLEETLEGFGYQVQKQGSFDNLIARPRNSSLGRVILLGAHYDSVPGCPGADDNGSAIAALLGVAKALAPFPELPVLFVSFNREEDGLMGSSEFVSEFLADQEYELEMAHVLEMVGYASDQPGTQSIPRGLPIRIDDRGNFLGIISNRDANRNVRAILRAAATYIPALRVKALKIFWGLERYFRDLLRSDHSPFWDARLPAMMWTDTANFRNPHYHLSSDTAETLNYEFLTQVTQLLTATIAQRGFEIQERRNP